MTVRAIVENGVIKLPADVNLPDGTEVAIQVGPLPERASDNEQIDPADRLSDEAVDFGISDLATQHDHYAYGTPKRKS